MEAFEAQVERMQRIFRGQETYGSGTPSAQATAFRFERMLPEIIRRAMAKSPTAQLPKVDLLVSLSGFSPATTIITFELLRPGRLLVLSSEGTEESIDVIHAHTVGQGKLPPRNFFQERCDSIDPYLVYKLVKQRVEPARSGAEHLSAIIDITGGKKVMSAAAALVAWRLDLPLCYVESDYDPEMRQPHPGTERLLILDNPTTLFRDDEMDAARAIFRTGAFATARDRFQALAESIPEPGRARFMRDLSGLYQAFADFDLDGLPAHIERVRMALDDASPRVELAAANRIRKQLDYLDDLAGRGEFIRFLPCFFVLGQHYREVGRLEFAALLYYRTAEGCFHQRLELQFPGFDCGDAAYERLAPDLPESQLLGRYNAVLAKLGRPPRPELPSKLGFLDAAIILHVLDDALLKRIPIAGVGGLSHLADLARARNSSLLAHGHRRVSQEQCESLESEVRNILRALWSLHRPEGERPEDDLDTVCESLRFLRDV
jgi:hypothetical protein